MIKYVILLQSIEMADSSVMLPRGAMPLGLVADLDGNQIAFLMQADEYRRQIEADPEFRAAFNPNSGKAPQAASQVNPNMVGSIAADRAIENLDMQAQPGVPTAPSMPGMQGTIHDNLKISNDMPQKSPVSLNIRPAKPGQ